jgi:hypothetical protein
MTDISSRLASLERRSPELVGTAIPIATVAATSTTPRLKLDVPRFDGTNPHGWIFKISQFFEYHRTPEEERITVASFYLDGAALAWYQWMYRNGQIVSWNQFLMALELCFAPTAYDDPKGKLFKLTQSSSVAAYLSEFESLANRIVGLSQLDLLSCFISGLKPEIRREVLAQQPATLNQASGLARLQEEKINDMQRFSRNQLANSWPTPKSSPAPASSSGVPSAPLLPMPASRPRFRQLTAAEMDERREKGLCFNCDERYAKGHRCKGRFLMFVSDTNDQSDEIISEMLGEMDLELVETDLGESEPAQLSFHALSGIQTGQTIRVLGKIESNPVHVLVDGGSTLNFIQGRVAQSLGL